MTRSTARSKTPNARRAAGKDAEGEGGKADRIETTRSFAEACPDGFASETPEWVAYCPECGAKIPVDEHLECEHFRGKQTDASGDVTSIECAYVRKPRIRPRKRDKQAP